MLKKMNLPNKLTMLRIILVPIFILILSIPASLFDNLEENLNATYEEKLAEQGSSETDTQITVMGLSESEIAKVSDWYYIIGYFALVVFAVAALTDFFDGRISRKNNIVTKFGKIMDPLADKLLVSAGFIMLTGLGIIPAFVTAIVVFRDFFVTALRMFGSDNSKDVAAGLSGKIKTLFQMLTVIFALLSFSMGNQYGLFAFMNVSSMKLFPLIVNVLVSVTTVCTIVATIWSFVDYFNRFKVDIDVEN